MKKALSIILSLVLVLSILPISVVAADNTVYTSSDGLWKYMILDDGTASITTNSSTPAYLGTEMSSVNIPLTIDGYRVSTVGLRAFQGMSVVNVYLPRSITKIDSYAFYNCADLSYVGLNDGLTRINYGAFLNSGLEYINIPDTVTLIATYAFKGCTQLRQVKLSSSMATVQEIFTGCTSLTSVYIYPSVTSINANAFSGCTSLNFFGGISGSFAETYASNNGLTFRSYPDFTVTDTLSVDTVYNVELDPDIDYSNVYFSFTPTASGWYSFESFDCTHNPECYLFDEVFKLEMYSYDDNNGSNFYFEEYYEAGKTYYFDCHNCSYVDEPTSFKVVLHKVEEISSITLDASHITAYENTTQEIGYEFYPDIDNKNYIDFISSNPTVVGVDESGMMYFRKEGTATVTVRLENGVSATLSVTVEAMPTIAAGESKPLTFADGYEEFYFAFTPAVSGYYNFYSISAIDMYGELCDSGFNTITYNDDADIVFNPDNYGDFTIQYYLTAGETYIYRIGTYNKGEEGNATVYLEAAPASQWVNFYCDEDVVFEGIPTDMYFEFDHENGAGDKLSSIVSSNTSVAVIGEISENSGYVLIKPVSAGSANITLTSENGLTKTVPITVTAAESISENVTKESFFDYLGDEFFKVFKFTATQTEDYSAKVTIGNGNEIEYYLFKDYENIAGAGSNESVTFSCTAGETYYLTVRLYSFNNYEDAPFSIDVATSVTATAIKFDAGDSITLAKECASGGLKFNCSFEPWNAETENYTITSSDDSVIYSDTNNYFYIAGIGTATLTATSSNGLTATLTVNVTEPEEIHVNDTKTADIKIYNSSALYKFIPEETAYYQFFSTKNSTYGECDSYGFVLDSEYNVLTSNDDGGGDLNFMATYRFEAGKTYYLKARTFGEGPGVFDVHLEKVTDLDVTMDGETDIGDIGFILSVSAGNTNPDDLSSYQFARCDRNVDGAIDGFDATILDRELVEGEYIGPNAFVKYINAVDSNGFRYTNGATVLIEPGEKLFIWFETDFARNASHGITPFVGFSENDPHVATLSPEGFTITGGTGEELGYDGITSFGFEIDATNVPVGTQAPIYMWLYEFDGTFPGAGFDFTTANIVYEDEVYFEVVENKDWWANNSEYIVEYSGEICEISGQSYSKTNDGKALVSTVFYTPSENVFEWTGPILVSTDPNAVTYTTNDNTITSGSFEYRGFTWYVSGHMDFVQGDINVDGRLPGRYSDLVDAAKALIDAADIFTCYS